MGISTVPKQTVTGRNPQYVYNPECICDWCANDGKPPKGYWIDSPFYGRVYHAPDGYGNEHHPPSRSPWRTEVKSA